MLQQMPALSIGFVLKCAVAGHFAAPSVLLPLMPEMIELAFCLHVKGHSLNITLLGELMWGYL